MTRTETKLPTDKTMWRRLKARAHPDTGGDHELFIWTGSVEDLVCSGVPVVGPVVPAQSPRRPEPTRRATTHPDRIPYSRGIDFSAITRRAVVIAEKETLTYARLLRLLVDCYPKRHLCRQQERGASYKQLALIAHTAGMNKEHRITWYRIAESIPLSDRHADHILSKLKRRAR